MSDHASPAKERRKADLRYAAVGIVALSSFAAMAIWMQGLSNDLRVSNQARDALARQVQSLGHSPVAGPPGSRGDAGVAGKSVVGPRGSKGATGASGKPAPTLTPSPGASGASGAPGKPGADSTVAGPTGPAGADSTVAGPAGPVGPVGPQGDQGPKGDTGDTGATGPAGPSCPDGYSLQVPSWDPNALVCEKDAPVDPSPTPSNPASVLLLGSAVLARRRPGVRARRPGRHRAGAHR